MTCPKSYGRHDAYQLWGKEFSQLVEPINPLKVVNRVWTDDMLAELANENVEC